MLAPEKGSLPGTASVPGDPTLNLSRLTDLISPDTLHNSQYLPILTANRTLWMDAQPPKYIRPFWDTWTMMDTVDRDCADLMQAFPEAIGPFLVHEADTWVPTNEISTYDDFEHLRLHPENARIATHYDELPISYGAVWVHFPPDSLWASLTPYDTIRNLRGREAAVAYREHGGQPYHFTVMSYDERGRPEALLRYTENLGFEAIHYEYNSMNKLIRLTAADPLRRHTTWYGYDNNGRVDSVWTAVDTVGSGTLLHGEPNNWGLENYVQQRPVEASITYTYTRTGKVDTMYYPQINVATWYHYTPRKWLDTLVATNGLVDLFRQELSYNNVGHITKQFSRQHGAPPNTQLYAYDAIGQLKTWSLNPLGIFNGTVQVYGYDDVGNRTSTTDFQGDPSTLQGSQSYSIGPDISNPTAGPNQLLKVQSYDATPAATDYTTFAYDPDGSMTVRTQYDPLGTPLFDDRYSYSSWRGLTTGFEREDLLGPPPPAPAMIWSWEYRYNAMGEREQKRETASPSGANSLPGHSWSYYLLNGTKEQLSVWRGAETGSAGTCTWAQEQVAYLYPAEYLVYAVEYPGIREDIPRLSLTPEGEVEYRITDHLASVRQTLDNGGQVVNQLDYEPFGAILSSQGVERQGFNSREHDGEDGLSNNGVRKLDEGLGRFVAVDPLWEKFPGWSPYQYGYNSPVSTVDPSGKQGVPLLPSWVPQPTGSVLTRVAQGTVQSTSTQVQNSSSGNGSTSQGESESSAASQVLATTLVVAGVLLADDVSGVGLADDPAIPFVLIGGSLYAGALAVADLFDGADGPETPGFPVPPIPVDPTQAPGEDWEWRGRGEVGSGQGSWYNPGTQESLHPDLTHPDPIGPHWDWVDPSGKQWRIPEGGGTPSPK